VIVGTEPDELDELEPELPELPEELEPLLPLLPADADELDELELPQAAMANAAMAVAAKAATSRTYLINRILLQEVRFPRPNKIRVGRSRFQQRGRSPNADPMRFGPMDGRPTRYGQSA
jgi:hypothetical protein